MADSGHGSTAPSSDVLGVLAFLLYVGVGGFLVFGFAWALRPAIDRQNDSICQAMRPESRTRVQGRVQGASQGLVELTSPTASAGAPTQASIGDDGQFTLYVPAGRHTLRVTPAGGNAFNLDITTRDGDDLELMIAPGGTVEESSRQTLVAPDFEVEDLAGNPVKLSDFRGKFVVVNFWATWCEPCITEWPQVHQLAERMADRSDVVVLAVSIDDDRDAIEPFLERMSLAETPVKVLWAREQPVHKRWGTEKIPDTFFVDEHGNMVFAFVNVRKWGSPEAYHCVNGISS